MGLGGGGRVGGDGSSSLLFQKGTISFGFFFFTVGGVFTRSFAGVWVAFLAFVFRRGLIFVRADVYYPIRGWLDGRRCGVGLRSGRQGDEWR